MPRISRGQVRADDAPLVECSTENARAGTSVRIADNPPGIGKSLRRIGRYAPSRIYDAEVAKYNRVVGFREIMPGEQILFPPLGDSAQ